MRNTSTLMILATILIASSHLEQPSVPSKHTLLKTDFLSSAIVSLSNVAVGIAINLRLTSANKQSQENSLYPSRSGHHISPAASELPLMVEVYVEENGERMLTDATAYLYDFNSGIVETYELAAKRNDIVIIGEPDIFYEFIVEKEGYWPSTTYFTYAELEEKLLEISLVDSTSASGPAVVFDPSATIFNMRLQFMDTGAVVLDWRNGDSKDTIEFAVDPNNEMGTAFVSREMGYVTFVPPAKITGDVHLIKGIYFDAAADKLDARAATGLEILSLSGGSMQSLNLSANSQLRSLSMLYMDPIDEFMLPEQHHIANLMIFGPGFPTENQLDYIVANIYANAVARNIVSGRAELVDTPVSPETASKLRALKANYGWELVVTPPIEQPNGVENFSVIDTRNGNELLDFADSVSLDVGHPDFRHWTIRANTYPDEVGSVIFKLDVQKKNVENEAPYLLAGHHLRGLTPTPHILEAEAYSERLGRGTRLQSRAALIKFTNNIAVNSLIVLDTEGGWVQELNDGDVIDGGDPRLRNFNIEALLNTNSDRASVQFWVNDELFWTENRAPYIMVTGNRKWWNEPGQYTITAIPYSARNGGGLAGTRRTVSFTISDNTTDLSSVVSRVAKDAQKPSTDSNKPAAVYPVPAKDVLYLLSATEFAHEEAIVTIRDREGHVLFTKCITLTSGPHGLEIGKMRLDNGMYYLQVATKTSSTNIRFIKE